MGKPTNHHPIQAQEELALFSVRSHALFPGRSSLYCKEVARATNTTAQHIRNLCADGTIVGAFSISKDANERRVGYWRIPVSAYDEWIKRKSNILAFQK